MRKINWWNIIIPAGIAIVYGIIVDNEYYLSIGSLVMINALAASGFNVLLGYTGIISIGQAAFFGIGAYTAGILSATYGWPPLMTFIPAAVLGIMVALIVGWPTLRLHGHYLAMATLGFGMIVYIVMNEWGAITGGPSGLFGIPDIGVFGVVLLSEIGFYTFMAAFFIISLIVFELFDKSYVSYLMKFIHSSESASSAYGVNVFVIKLTVFCLVAGYTAVVGALFAYYTNFISPVSFSVTYSIELLAMAVVGGLGSIGGGIVGAAILTMIPEFFAFIEDYEMIVYGGFLAVVVMFFPGGITGLVGRVFRRGDDA